MWKRLRNEYRRSGLLGTLDVFTFRLFYKISRSKADGVRIQEIMAPCASEFRGAALDASTLVGENVNSTQAQEFLGNSCPDLAIARCKHILRPDVFGIPAKGVVCLSPRALSRVSQFTWLLLGPGGRGTCQCGLTVLRVDFGIYTGPIFGFFSFGFDPPAESHVIIQLRVLTEKVRDIASLLLAVINGRATPGNTTGARSAVWGQPRVTAYLRYQSYFKGTRNAATQS